MRALDLSMKNTEPAPSGTSIFQLNEDCLLEIFSYLNVRELWSIANVHGLFTHIARVRFSSKHSSIKLETLGVENMRQLENFLAIFGSLIVSLEAALPNLFAVTGAFEFDHDIQKLIARYCRGTLRELRLAHFEIVLVEMWRPLFAALQKLHLHRCRFTDQFVQMLACCVELEQMEWNTSKIDIDWSLRFPLPKLKIFRVNEVDGITTETMTVFLRSNPQLKEFGVTKCHVVGSHILGELARNLPLIENVSLIDLYDVSCAPKLRSLRALKALQIDVINEKIISRLLAQSIANGNRLEHLDLALCVGSDHLFDEISSIRTLKSLGLFSIFGMVYNRLLNVIKNLENLTHLHIVNCIGLHSTELIEIVRVAKQLRQLQLHLPLAIVMISNPTRHELSTVVRTRADKIPLEILITVKGTGRNEKWQDTWASADGLLNISCVHLNDLCNRYQKDDFFLFNYFYDYHVSIKTTERFKPMSGYF